MEPGTAQIMEFAVEPAGPCRKKITVTIPPERVADEFDKSYRTWARTVPIPGFRPGKAPRRLVEKKYAAEVAQEVKQHLLETAYERAIEENDLEPLAQPELDLEGITVEPSQQVSFDFTVTVKPEFDLPDLKGIEVQVPSAEPTDEDMEDALRTLQRRKAILKPIDGPVAQGDVVSLNVRGSADDDEVFHEENLSYEVGSRYLGGLIAEGLDEDLVGHKSGDRAEGTATAPPHEDQHPLAGVTVQIEAEILDIKRPELPKVDDAFAKGFDFDSKQELLDTVRKDVAAQKQRERGRLIEDLALEQLVNKVTLDLPEDLIDQEAQELSRRAAYELQLQGKTPEEIARQVSEMRTRRTQAAAQELKVYFLLDKLVKAERVIVTENEVKEAVAILAAHNKTSPEQMYGRLRDAGRLGSLRNQLRERKARAKLRKKVTVKELQPPKKTAAKKKTAEKEN